MKKQKKNKESKKKDSSKKDIVVFDSKLKNYNIKILEEYFKVAKINPIGFGRELGEMIGFIKDKSRDIMEAKDLLDMLNRLIDTYVEAGTYNGSKNIVPFKFKKINEEERQSMIKEYKKKLGIKDNKEVEKEEKIKSDYIN